MGDCECDADSDLLVVEVRGMTPWGWWWWDWLWGPRALRRPSMLRVLPMGGGVDPGVLGLLCNSWFRLEASSAELTDGDAQGSGGRTSIDAVRGISPPALPGRPGPALLLRTGVDGFDICYVFKKS